MYMMYFTVTRHLQAENIPVSALIPAEAVY